MEVSGQLHAPAALPPRYLLDKRLSGPRRRSGHGVEEKNSQPPPGIKAHQVVQPVASRATDSAISALVPYNEGPTKIH
jgi:hypothetical protein